MVGPTQAHHYATTHIIFWQDVNTASFIKQLKNQGINKIIYMGFASNMYILMRPIGMAKLFDHGFSLYVIPKASAAVETKETWKNRTIHKIMTIVIAQTFARLIDYDAIFWHGSNQAYTSL
ncbi:MAG: hypothetical protein GY820_46620 [Gammaproteobacteria bacterium]|nr:hypothetical protein [Gammaproteobacteria bacterium]